MLSVYGIYAEGAAHQRTRLPLPRLLDRRRPRLPDIRLPFFHLHGDGCWMPLDDAAQVFARAENGTLWRAC